MPLTEFLRRSKGKVEAAHLKPSPSNDPSCGRGDSDCVELVWENGHITAQGQCNKPKKVPNPNHFQTLVPKARDNSKIANGAKVTNLSSMETVLLDFPLCVPSSGMGLDPGIDMAPWLSYAVEDPLHNDYNSDFLRELSGVTINDAMEKKCGFQNNGSLGAKDPSNAEKHTEVRRSEVPHQFSLPFQNNFSKSGMSGISETKTSNSHHVKSRDSVVNQSSLYDFTSFRLQKLDAGHSSTTSTSGFTNFSYFSRPAAIARANNLTVNESNRVEGYDNSSALANSTVVNFSDSQKETVSCSQSVQVSGSRHLELLPAKPMEELRCSDKVVCRDDVIMMNASQNESHCAELTKAKVVGEGNKVSVVATSSVCSRNSVERASNELSHDLKRKCPEVVESDTPSDEADEESMDAKKAVLPRSSAKRSRAAEVHNLSERRRRDRINEKMRALQELIPNCNKVDKASMLDEAIEYLKTLQLQVQMLSMGTGLYMQPMMVTPGIQPIHGAQMPHFSPMGVGGMTMGMGLGMNMLNMNSSMKLPFHGPQYPIAGSGPSFQVMAGSSLQPLGQHGQGIPMPLPQVPVLPMPGISPLKTPMAANVLCVGGSTNATLLYPSSSSKDATPQSVPGNNVDYKVTNESTENAPHHQAPAVNNASVSINGLTLCLNENYL